MISPAGRATGFLVALTLDIAAADAPAYMRLLGEMNNCSNPYAAHDCSGRRRDRDHAAATFTRAWKRVHVFMHGDLGSDAPAFVDRLFDWIAGHRRVQMVHYNQGAQAGGIFRLSRYPASARMIRATRAI